MPILQEAISVAAPVSHPWPSARALTDAISAAPEFLKRAVMADFCRWLVVFEREANARTPPTPRDFGARVYDYLLEKIHCPTA